MRLTPTQFAKIINSLREEWKEVILNPEEMAALLKSANIPSSTIYFVKYSKYGIITKIGRGKYTFPETPIYIGVIEQVMKEITEFQNGVVSRKENEELKNKIASSIAFLKQNGYLVFKQM